MSFEPLENFFLFFQKIWDTPIVQIKGVSMTIGTLSLGIILLFLSFFLANFLSKHIGKKILSRVKEIDEASRISVQKIIYYILLLIFIVFSLGILNVPLTVLTVFGGGFSYWCGFGSSKYHEQLHQRPGDDHGASYPCGGCCGSRRLKGGVSRILAQEVRKSLPLTTPPS